MHILGTLINPPGSIAVQKVDLPTFKANDKGAEISATSDTGYQNLRGQATQYKNIAPSSTE